MPMSTLSISVIVHESLLLATRQAKTIDDYLLDIIT